MHLQAASVATSAAAQLQPAPTPPPEAAHADPFADSAGPTVYMSDNRMSARLDYQSALIYALLGSLLLALLAILPGIRRTKATSLLSLLALATMGAAVLLGLEGSHWLSGGLQLHQATTYSALSAQPLVGRLEVHIGLQHANVSLAGHLSGPNGGGQLHYNERFGWLQPEQLAAEHLRALRQGLPYPILTVSDFLAQGLDGFGWTHQLRRAGHYTGMALYATGASWLLSCLVLCALPCYLPHMLQITGSLAMLSVSLYSLLVESPRLYAIQLGPQLLELAYGSSYVSTLLAGALSLLVGVLLYALQMSGPREQLTIMDGEDYVKDRKQCCLARRPGAAGSAGQAPPVASEPGSVYIPIDDIEKNFPSAART